MKTTLFVDKRRRQEGSMIAYLIVLAVLVSGLASLAVYVTQTTHNSRRRSDMLSALHYAQGGALVAGTDVDKAFTNTVSPFPWSLTNSAYTYSSASSTNGMNVYLRTITAPFTNQTVASQIVVPNSSSSSSVKIVSSATVGKVAQTVTLNLVTKFGYGAAILSTHDGTSNNGISKSTAQDGNVCVDGSSAGKTVVDGGSGYAILCNGRANVDNAYAIVPPGSISQTNRNTANEIPDYTAQGTLNTLFDFNRFIAVADLTTNSFMTNAVPFRNNHFTNMASFKGAVIKATTNFMEGVIVVNVKLSELNDQLYLSDFANYPIRIHGTLLFNMASDIGPGDKLWDWTTLEINPADLSGLVATDPSTYTTGYPPKFNDWNKCATNIDITSKGFANFSAADDMPALMYNQGIVDIHGNANICGVLYTPAFVEIENKYDDQIQYFKGSIIAGGGVYVDNGKAATTVISYDPAALDYLATISSKGKKVFAAFWQ